MEIEVNFVFDIVHDWLRKTVLTLIDHNYSEAIRLRVFVEGIQEPSDELITNRCQDIRDIWLHAIGSPSGITFNVAWSILASSPNLYPAFW